MICLEDLQEDFRKVIRTQFPSPLKEGYHHLSDEEKISRIAEHFQNIMEILGLDLSDDSLQKTPQRVARMYVKELFNGLNEDSFPDVTTIENKFSFQESNLVLVKDIIVNSCCEHHFVPMIGKACVAYFPGQKVIGLSKINRIVRFYSQRPQVQERLNAQIADCLSNVLDTENVAVSISARHYCVCMRGIKDVSSTTSTFVYKGRFKQDPSLRQEFLAAQSYQSFKEPGDPSL